jgi:shikimate dehydrogenase
VNTIAIREGRLIGYNTDVEGFRTSLLELVGEARPRALVLGSGGASRAVVYVLKELGIRFRVVSRSMERGDLTWDLLDPIIVKACPLIINTTPLGMYPEVGAAPELAYKAIGPRHCLLDLIYNPAETVFLRRGREQGARTVNGMPMLLAQAEAAWRIWNAAN